MANNTNEKKMKNGSGHEQHSELQSDANSDYSHTKKKEFKMLNHLWGTSEY